MVYQLLVLLCLMCAAAAEPSGGAAGGQAEDGGLSRDPKLDEGLGEGTEEQESDRRGYRRLLGVPVVEGGNRDLQGKVSKCGLGIPEEQSAARGDRLPREVLHAHHLHLLPEHDQSGQDPEPRWRRRQ